jgi:ABC-2 type transport system ATP-binding protein
MEHPVTPSAQSQQISSGASLLQGQRPPDNEIAISVSGLKKNYGDIEAVRGVDFEVRRGEIFGLLGPNGAGKSTTINMLCTLSTPTDGSATVAGYDVVQARDAVRQSIGLVFQDTTLDGYLTAERNLRFHAELYGVPRHIAGERMRQVMEMVGLWDRRESKVQTSTSRRWDWTHKPALPSGTTSRTSRVVRTSPSS